MSESFQVSEIEELLALMEQWGIAEMHLTVEESTLDLVRTTAEQAEVPAAAAQAPSAPAVAAPPEAEEPHREPSLVIAPVVGVFHLAQRGFPQGSPRVGDQVQAGQVIGSIELMHVPTDLVSPVSGIIEAILTEDGAGVEYGQPLMAIQPYEEAGEDEAGMLPPPVR